ncbi:hypothetical protein OHV05_27290 [Kitasatospora sp. NBC_00070]|uniref:hypothetical protein n=1 Tax=Kitasatospora sp. NBC_00070 TaxID=2975962 RepID=UPI00325103E8
MNPVTRAAAAALAALALTLAVGCSASSDDAPVQTPSVAAVALPAPREAPAPAAVLASPAAAGQVRLEEGPFTDRIKFTGLALAPQATAVTGHLAITSDVSDVLVLEVRAAFYDAAGRLLGSGSFQYQEEEATGTSHDDRRAEGAGIDFTVPATGVTGTPAGAVLTVPVLVNE